MRRFAYVLLWLSMPSVSLFGQFRPLEEVHSESVRELVVRFGFSPYALLGNNPQKANAYAQIIFFEKQRVQALQRSNATLIGKGAQCDEIKAQQAATIDRADDAARAMGLNYAWRIAKGDEQLFNNNMFALHRQLRVEYARQDMLQADLKAKERIDNQKRTQAAAARPSVQNVAPKNNRDNEKKSLVGRFSDAEIFYVAFLVFGICVYLKPLDPDASFIVRAGRWFWVIMGVYSAAGYLVGGPRGAMAMTSLVLVYGMVISALLAFSRACQIELQEKGDEPETYGQAMGRGFGLGLRKHFWTLALLVISALLWSSKITKM